MEQIALNPTMKGKKVKGSGLDDHEPWLRRKCKTDDRNGPSRRLSSTSETVRSCVRCSWLRRSTKIILALFRVMSYCHLFILPAGQCIILYMFISGGRWDYTLLRSSSRLSLASGNTSNHVILIRRKTLESRYFTYYALVSLDASGFPDIDGEWCLQFRHVHRVEVSFNIIFYHNFHSNRNFGMKVQDPLLSAFVFLATMNFEKARGGCAICFIIHISIDFHPLHALPLHLPTFHFLPQKCKIINGGDCRW